MPEKPSIRLRERRPDDILLYREIHHLAYHPDTHRGDEQEKEWEEMQDGAGTVLRLIGFLGEHAVAAGSIAAMPFLPNDGCVATLAVRPAVQRRGIGSTLARALERFALSHGMRIIQCSVHESDLARIGSWLAREGFVEWNRTRLSRLLLRDLDPIALGAAEGRVLAQGLIVTALGLEDTEENRHKLWQLHVTTHHDVPWRTPSPDVPYDKFARRFEPPYLLNCTVVVRDGERYVGFTHPYQDGPGQASTSMTGVLREYRHRGIAPALKSRCARLLHDRGYVSMTTMNHVSNAAMLAVNRKLGYTPVADIVFLEKQIERPPSGLAVP